MGAAQTQIDEDELFARSLQQKFDSEYRHSASVKSGKNKGAAKEVPDAAQSPLDEDEQFARNLQQEFDSEYRHSRYKKANVKTERDMRAAKEVPAWGAPVNPSEWNVNPKDFEFPESKSANGKADNVGLEDQFKKCSIKVLRILPESKESRRPHSISKTTAPRFIPPSNSVPVAVETDTGHLRFPADGYVTRTKEDKMLPKAEGPVRYP